MSLSLSLSLSLSILKNKPHSIMAHPHLTTHVEMVLQAPMQRPLQYAWPVPSVLTTPNTCRNW